MSVVFRNQFCDLEFHYWFANSKYFRATMTCGLAVKRPHDYETYMVDSGVEVKRPRPTNAHCSPFRPQFGTLAASLPHSNTLNLLRDRVSQVLAWKRYMDRLSYVVVVVCGCID